MPHILAAILIQLDQPHVGKQELLCFEYAIANRLQVFAVTQEAAAALSMIVAGTVAAIISAIDPGGTLRVDVERCGGQLYVVREARRRRRDVDQLAERMYESGLDTKQIAKILQVPPEDVRRDHFRRNLRRQE